MLPDNIQFTKNAAQSIVTFLADRRYSSITIVADENTKKYCYPVLEGMLPAHTLIAVSAGEEHKTLETCTAIWQKMTDLQLDRHALVIVLGGGVLGDMAGFCAATYKRGIDFVLVPTTLLAQVDASIGGKLGIDFNHFKNHIGVFQLPALTLIYSGFLITLPNEELRSGYAEVVKHILTSDAGMWETIKDKPFEELDWDTLVRHSVAFKSQVVTEDPKERGRRKILNAGHTIGHALETYFISKKDRVLHGYAIAIGLIAEGHIAMTRNLLTQQQLEEITTYLLAVYGKKTFTTSEADAIAALAIQDKKNRDNKILCVLLNGIGDARWDIEVSTAEIKSGLEYYQNYR